MLQTYRGLPALNVLPESYDTPTAKLSTTASTVPGNGPWFVIFGDLKFDDGHYHYRWPALDRQAKTGRGNPICPV